MVAGGYFEGWIGLTEVELFLPHSGTTKICSFMSLPIARIGATLDTIDSKAVLCGGYITPIPTDHYNTTCILFNDGKWSDYAKLMFRRQNHNSWVSGAGLVIMGGEKGTDSVLGGNSTEIVPSGGGQSVQGFNLKYGTE